MRTFLLFMAMLALAGCRNTISPEAALSDAEVEALLRTASELTTDKPSYTPGETVLLTLQNLAPEEIGYNLCNSLLQRQAGAGWETIPGDRVCPAVIYTLHAGESATSAEVLPSELTAGTYRFVTRVHLLEQGIMGDRISNSFQVRTE